MISLPVLGSGIWVLGLRKAGVVQFPLVPGFRVDYATVSFHAGQSRRQSRTA